MKSRLIKGISDKLYLIESDHRNNGNERKFIVMGSTGNVYDVLVKDDPTCTCPDYKLRGNRCKHIFFILLRVMKCTNPDEEIFSSVDLREMFNNVPSINSSIVASGEIKKVYHDKVSQIPEIELPAMIERKPLDDHCPVCLDSLSEGEVDYCKYSCGKPIHKICLKFWSKRKKATCVYCRKDWNVKSKSEKYDKYMNLLIK